MDQDEHDRFREPSEAEKQAELQEWEEKKEGMRWSVNWLLESAAHELNMARSFHNAGHKHRVKKHHDDAKVILELVDGMLFDIPVPMFGGMRMRCKGLMTKLKEETTILCTETNGD
jgi:hypothetical protein